MKNELQKIESFINKIEKIQIKISNMYAESIDSLNDFFNQLKEFLTHFHRTEIKYLQAQKKKQKLEERKKKQRQQQQILTEMAQKKQQRFAQKTLKSNLSIQKLFQENEQHQRDISAKKQILEKLQTRKYKYNDHSLELKQLKKHIRSISSLRRSRKAKQRKAKQQQEKEQQQQQQEFEFVCEDCNELIYVQKKKKDSSSSSSTTTTMKESVHLFLSENDELFILKMKKGILKIKISEMIQKIEKKGKIIILFLKKEEKKNNNKIQHFLFTHLNDAENFHRLIHQKINNKQQE